MASNVVHRAPFFDTSTGGVDDAIARRLLGVALSAGATYADLFFEYRSSFGMVLEEGIVKSASKSVSMGMGVRAQVGDKTGFAYVEDLSFAAMERAARVASEIAEHGGGVAPESLATVTQAARYELAELSNDVSASVKKDLLERAAKHAQSRDARVLKVEASYVEEIRETLLFTSEGKRSQDIQPLLRFGVRVVAEENGKRQEGSSGGGGRAGLAYFDSHSPESHAEEAVRQALVMLDAREAPAGEMEVVLAPGDSGILLHEAVGHGLEADFNRKRTSNYTDAIGTRVASELCTVVDDATLGHSRGSLNVDDEGNVPSSSTLIENGVLVGYMHDRHSAAHFKVAPSGNGRRESYASVPLPRMTNTLLREGKSDPAEVIASVKRGVYASKFGGGQVDISNGDFVFSLTEGYLIEDGKITAPLKGVNLIGNGPDVLREVVMLGNDPRISDGIWTCGKAGQSVPVGVGCPTVKIAKIVVGGTTV